MPSLFLPEYERWLWAIGVGSIRTIPIVWLIPAFGGQNVPQQVRMGLGLALSALVLPQVLLSLPTGGSTLFWMILLAREAAVGLAVGFVAACVFRAAEVAGRLVDTLRGANMAEVLSPVTEGRSSPLGDIYLLLTVVIFLELGGIGRISLALARSYDAVPLDLERTGAGMASVATLVILTTGKLLESAIALCAPAIVALFLADLILGAIARMAPQIPVYFVGMPLKALAGVGIVFVTLGGLETALYGIFEGWAVLVDRAFEIWR